MLPRLTGAEGSRRGFKRFNIFPPPGVHRLKRPGGGSELLDLRDYIPGDPPKMIAWKPSARRDKLFTKEFESEVPVRCTMFVDNSESVRLGAKRTKLTRLVNLAAGVAEAAVADRDHAGLVVFDENDMQIMRPKRSRRHVIDMLHLLAESAARPTPLGPFADTNALARLAFPLAHELYPDLMHKRINSKRFGMFWSPPSDYRRGWWVLAFWLPFMVVALNYLTRQVAYVLRNRDLWDASYAVSKVFYRGADAFTIHLFNVPVQILRAWPITLGIALIGVFIWLLHGLSGFIEPWRSERLRRKQLGLLFATLDGDQPGAHVSIIYTTTSSLPGARSASWPSIIGAIRCVCTMRAAGTCFIRAKDRRARQGPELRGRARPRQRAICTFGRSDRPGQRTGPARFRRSRRRGPAPPGHRHPAVAGRRAGCAQGAAGRRHSNFLAQGRSILARRVSGHCGRGRQRLYRELPPRILQVAPRIRKDGRRGRRADSDEPVQMVLDRLDRLRGVGRRK